MRLRFGLGGSFAFCEGEQAEACGLTQFWGSGLDRAEARTLGQMGGLVEMVLRLGEVV